MKMLTTKDRLELIKTQVEPYRPVIIAVTKYFNSDKIIEYFNLGIRNFGENRVQDALEKMNSLPEKILKESNFHLIGHLQTNKVKDVVGKFYLIHSVDSLKLAEKISCEAERKGVIQNILLQVNMAKEPQKYGFDKDDLKMCYSQIVNLPNLKVLGLMNIAPKSEDELYLKSLFTKMNDLKNELSANYELKELSIGMSNDYLIAVKCGATMIRLGRVLFQDIDKY